MRGIRRKELDDDEDVYEDFCDREFSIQITKRKGRDRTEQFYQGTKAEIMTCIASMSEQLLKYGVATEEELHEAISMGCNKEQFSKCKIKRRRW